MPHRAVFTLAIFAFVTGVFTGYIFKSTALTMFGPGGNTYVCPSIETVLENKAALTTWTQGDLQWTTYTQKPVSSNTIAFSQAVIQRMGNKLVCQYEWQEPGFTVANQKILVQLNPAGNQVVAPSGEHWRRTSTVSVCTSGDPKTCPFLISTQGG